MKLNCAKRLEIEKMESTEEEKSENNQNLVEF